jgi:hypothetical protein
VEARLTDLTCDTPVPLDARPREAIVAHPPADRVPPRSELLDRIDRYLRAAGVSEAAQLSRLTAATARDLVAQGTGPEPAWAEIIAAVDRSLADDLSAEYGHATAPRARGRVALALAGTVPEEAGDVFADDWGTPPRRARPMRPQDLSLWRPSADRLLRVRLSRPAQGLVACLCWLLVLFVP